MREEKDYSNFMTTVELAARWKKSPRTLENWRVQGIGPNFYKIGENAREHILKTYDQNKISKKLVGFFESVL